MRRDVGILPFAVWLASLALVAAWAVHDQTRKRPRPFRAPVVPVSTHPDGWEAEGEEWKHDPADERDVPEPEPKPDYKNPLWAIGNPDAYFKAMRDRFNKADAEGRPSGEERCPKCGAKMTVRAGWPFCPPCGDLWFDDFEGYSRRIRQRPFDPPDPRQQDGPEPPAEAA